MSELELVNPAATAATTHDPANRPDHIIEYYSDAGMDYEAWSPAFNMHFGYWRPGINPFRLEAMLEELSAQVLKRIGLRPHAEARVLDMGCGIGATLRHAARTCSGWRLHGVTLVPWQVEQARARTRDQRIEYHRADYTCTPFPSQSLDGAYAIESSCHDDGLDKPSFIREAARLLKPGAKLVVADGFLKQTGRMHPAYRFCYQHTCDFWALETFAGITEFTKTLAGHGFSNIQVEEISWPLLPSVLHVPRVTLKYFFTQVFHPKHRMTRESWRHVTACLLAPLVGLSRRRFGYFLVTAESGACGET